MDHPVDALPIDLPEDGGEGVPVRVDIRYHREPHAALRLPRPVAGRNRRSPGGKRSGSGRRGRSQALRQYPPLLFPGCILPDELHEDLQLVPPVHVRPVKV